MKAISSYLTFYLLAYQNTKNLALSGLRCCRVCVRAAVLLLAREGPGGLRGLVPHLGGHRGEATRDPDHFGQRRDDQAHLHPVGGPRGRLAEDQRQEEKPVS